jgi:hypothetical protein
MHKPGDPQPGPDTLPALEVVLTPMEVNLLMTLTSNLDPSLFDRAESRALIYRCKGYLETINANKSTNVAFIIRKPTVS